ncbi:MAG TPA: hypothetical protein PLA94_11250 [Myxococcota bacterium]|nr:hypothetical protein [Myxococcota bacterium]HND30571.1 hypothetical protein [Myxococcota bacterium]
MDKKTLPFFAQKNQDLVIRTNVKAGAAESKVKAREQAYKGD